MRVGRHVGGSGDIPLIVVNGIGGNIELLAPLASSMPGRELLTFDVRGVGHSPLPASPYPPRHIAALAAALLDRYGHVQADVLGMSRGGALAQEFVRSHAARSRRLVLCAIAPGAVMIPARHSVLRERGVVAGIDDFAVQQHRCADSHGRSAHRGQ